LKLGWKPELGEVCAAIERRFPEIGRVRASAAKPDSGVADTFLIDGATVSMSIVNAPYPPEQLIPPVRLVEHVDADAVGRAHLCYVMLSAEAPEGIEWAQAYSALVTLVASVVAEEAPALAAFWASSWALRTPEGLREAADEIMAGGVPRSFWVSLAEVRSAKVNGIEMRGMMSFGLRPFAGREIELAPAPISLAAARAFSEKLADRMLAGEMPEDWETIAIAGHEKPAVVRLAERFMRPSQPVALIVAHGATVDPETLKPRKGGIAAKGGGGLVSRLFGGRG
jgi:hypothetical protein